MYRIMVSIWPVYGQPYGQYMVSICGRLWSVYGQKWTVYGWYMGSIWSVYVPYMDSIQLVNPLIESTDSGIIHAIGIIYPG